MGPIFIPASDRTNIQQKSRKVLNSMDFVKILSMGIYRKPMEFSHGKKRGFRSFFRSFFPPIHWWIHSFRGFMGSPKVGTWSRDVKGLGAARSPVEPGNQRVFASVCHKICCLKHVETKKTPTFDPWWFSPVSVGSLLGCQPARLCWPMPAPSRISQGLLASLSHPMGPPEILVKMDSNFQQIQVV